jgi:hypothetical protein
VDDPSLPSVDISPDMRRELEEKVGGGATQEAQEILTAWREGGGPIESILPFIVTTILSYRAQAKRAEGTIERLRSILLREIEWSGLDNVCPWCGASGPHPTLGGGPTPGVHRGDCRLAAEVGKNETPFPCCDKMRDSQGDYPDRIPSDARFCPWCGVRRGV